MLDETNPALSETVRSILQNFSPDEICSLPPEASAYEAIAIMAGKNMDNLFAISNGRLVGVVTEKDYAIKIILQGRSSTATTVGEIMNSAVATITPSDSAEECLRRMDVYHLREIPILEANSPIGAISAANLMRAIIASQAETIRQLRCYITGSYI